MEVKDQDGKKRRLVKKDFELRVLGELAQGIMPVEIAAKYNMKPGHLSYYLSSLIKQKAIQRVGITWEILAAGQVKLSSHKGDTQVGGQVKDKRGHAFIWKVKPSKAFGWVKLLKEKEIHFEVKGIAYTPRIILNGKKIWLGQRFITIFEPEEKSFYGRNALEAKKEAIWELIDTIDSLKKVLGIDFKYQFTCSRHHYGHIENLIAQRARKEKRSYVVKNEKGYWMSIDFSLETPETEFNGAVDKNDPDKHSMQFERFWNSHERTGFKADADFTLAKFKELDKVAEEISSRVKRVSEMELQVSQVLEQSAQNDIRITKRILELEQEVRVLRSERGKDL